MQRVIKITIYMADFHCYLTKGLKEVKAVHFVKQFVPTLTLYRNKNGTVIQCWTAGEVETAS